MISFLLMSLSVFCLAGDYTVLVNTDNQIDKISKDDLKSILLGKKTTWEDGQKIKVAVYKDNDTHKAILKDMVKKSPMQFSLYWKKIVFSGSGTPIKIVKDETEMVNFIINNPTAIGYISTAHKNEKIKIIQIIE